MGIKNTTFYADFKQGQLSLKQAPRKKLWPKTPIFWNLKSFQPTLF
jgi:hypothetical protein